MDGLQHFVLAIQTVAANAQAEKESLETQIADLKAKVAHLELTEARLEALLLEKQMEHDMRVAALQQQVYDLEAKVKSEAMSGRSPKRDLAECKRPLDTEMEHVKPSISASTPAQLLMKKEEHRILPNAVQNAGSHLDSIPDTRRIILQALPKVPFSLPDEGLGMAFKRPYIAQHVGGGSVTSTGKTMFGFRLRANPWLPRSRMEHGFAFVGLPGNGGDDKIGLDGPRRRHLFIEPAETQGGTSWHYFGVYEFSLIEDDTLPDRYITTEEWNALTAQVRESYIPVAAKRYVTTESAMVEAFQSGKKHCPVRLARCVGFDQQLYSRLVNNTPIVLSRGQKVVDVVALDLDNFVGVDHEEGPERKKVKLDPEYPAVPTPSGS